MAEYSPASRCVTNSHDESLLFWQSRHENGLFIFKWLHLCRFETYFWHNFSIINHRAEKREGASRVRCWNPGDTWHSLSAALWEKTVLVFHFSKITDLEKHRHVFTHIIAKRKFMTLLSALFKNTNSIPKLKRVLCVYSILTKHLLDLQYFHLQ